MVAGSWNPALASAPSSEKSRGLSAGTRQVMLGTSAIKNPELVKTAVGEFGANVAVSIDVSGAFAASAGWKEISSISFSELSAQMRSIGVKELLFTDTSRDGTLLGPDIPKILSYLEAAAVPVTISGGITTLEDVIRLKALESKGLRAIVIGKALYDQQVRLEDILAVA